MPRETRIHRVAMRAPDDVEGLRALIDRGEVDPARLCAVMGKTEGNGCVNDFSRALSLRAVGDALGAHAEGVAMVFSGGTEGGLSPHLLLFEVVGDHEPSDGGPQGGGARQPAMAIGTAITPDLSPEDIGTPAQIDSVARGVAEAMARAGIERSEDVHFAQVKCPLLTIERVAEAAARSRTTATTNTLKSMGISRGACSLGVGVALGEFSREEAARALAEGDQSVFSSRASASAGIELMGNEIIVMGNSPAWRGRFAIEHGVMEDAIDTAAAAAATARLEARGFAEVFTVLAKAEPSSSGLIRGRRHVMLGDSDISPTRHARALVGGVLAGLFQRTDIYVSGGAEHQVRPLVTAAPIRASGAPPLAPNSTTDAWWGSDPWNAAPIAARDPTAAGPSP